MVSLVIYNELLDSSRLILIYQCLAASPRVSVITTNHYGYHENGQFGKPVAR